MQQWSRQSRGNSQLKHTVAALTEAADLGRRAELGARLLHLLIETPEKLVVLRANLAELELPEQPGRRRVDAQRLGIDDLFLLLLVAQQLLLALAHGVRG